MKMLRVGKVTKADINKRLVKVHFEDVNIESGWLKVLDTTPSTRYEDAPKDEPRTAKEQAHYHSMSFISWFPSVGCIVLCAYNDGFNEDGFVLGAIK
ncbi:MAG: hypothetical protein NC299_08815 [Lachnospiraceae bacterium]|nr:hypothetical protein [Lachnospiraceae bacterium]